jgi:hypothetical protein
MTRLFLTLLLCAGMVAGQTITGRISGQVTDPSGASLPGAAITATNEATGLTWTTATNERGDYVLTPLPPGTYSVSVKSAGFRTSTRTGINLVSDGRATANFTMEIGEVATAVEVIASAAEAVNVVSGEISRTLDSSQVQDLALNGRNYMQLVTLIPGTALLNDDQLALTTSLSTTGQAVNGNRPNTSNLTVDGAFNLDAGSNGSQINNVGIDFIREVQVKSSNFSAEYGRQSGAAINVVTRSGTNDFHGSAFEFLRNDKLDARSFFAPSKPSLRFNNFGYSFGGPILKSKLFFFGGQEWKYIRRYTDPARRTLPTRAERRGDFTGRTSTLNLPGTTTPVPGRDLSGLITPNGRAIAAVYDQMEQLAASYTDTPTANNAIYQLPNPFDFRQDLVRVDYRLNESHSFYGRYLHDDYNVSDPFGTFVVSQLPTVPGNRLRPANSWQAAHTWIARPNLINEARGNAGWHSQRVLLEGDYWSASRYGFDYRELFEGGGRYPTGIPNTSIAGFSGFTGPTYYVSTTTDISLSDTLTWTTGTHTVRSGFLFTRNRKDANGRPPLTGAATFNPSGNPLTTGNALADALIGNFRTYSEAQYDPIGMFRFSQYDAFITDQWKINRRLNIEFGVRYQSLLPVYTVANNVANFVPARYDPARAVTVLNNGTVVPGSGDVYNGIVRAGDGIPADQLGRVPDGNRPEVLGVPAGAPRGLHNAAHPFAPRFSFAYSPDANGKTAIRGGFGMFYDRIDQTAIVQGGLAMPPYGERVQFENGNLADPTSGRPQQRGVTDVIRPIDENLKWPHTMHYSLSVQRELPAGVFMEAAYVGNQSRHLMRQPDINLAPFSLLASNAALPAAQRASVNALRPFKGYSQILMRVSDANSNYNALQLYATKRTGALTWTAGYTFSKALTDASSNGEASDEPFNRRYNYGPASFDRTHIFVGTFVARMPSLRNLTAWQRGIAGGWELSGIGRTQTGQPFTVVSATAIATRRADYIGGEVALPAGERSVSRWFNTAAFATPPDTRLGTAGFGTVRGPGLTLFDISLRKVFSITEQVKLRVQADAFNAFNKANFRAPNVNTTNLDFGSVTAAGPGRNIQLGMRLVF